MTAGIAARTARKTGCRSQMIIAQRNIEVPDDAMLDVLRAKTPQERLLIAFEMWDCASRYLASHLHSLHPDWNEEEVRRETASRLSHGTV